MIKRIEIVSKYPVGLKGLEGQIPNFKGSITKASYYVIETEVAVNEDVLKDAIIDESLQTLKCEQYDLEDLGCVLDVHFLPGVTDNSAKALEEALALKGVVAHCSSGSLYFVQSKEPIDVESIGNTLRPEVGNPLIQDILILSKESFHSNERFLDSKIPAVNIHHDESAHEVSLEGSVETLNELSRSRCLALNQEEMLAIRAYYREESTQKRRLELGLPQWPTDVELEVLAQTWSEHCKHKIFAADIEYHDERTGKRESIQGLYPSYIKKATKELADDGVDWLVSVFSDNAGIVRFDQKTDLCIKVETHNSPSALDPYGGAITGILGVNRDILGCGLGAKPIANTNVFCLGQTELPQMIDPNSLPAGLMEPAKLLRGVHKGVEDGGNKSGIPTVNGAIVFDQDYAGKPLVFCGTVGILPPKLPDGREGSEKGAVVGNKIYVVGGAVGADGIHGATFSSMELNEDSPATAVQIGDPLTQKRVMDFLLVARDRGLYNCITDNGAGGISSSIGEMAELTGGARIDLNRHPRKYPGLSPWEIMISESQERMTCAVSSEKVDEFESLAKERGVSAICMGEFTDNGALEIFYKDQRVGQLEMTFLHDGVPKLQLKAKSVRGEKRESWVQLKKKNQLPPMTELFPLMMKRENIASKEPWVRQYDHEVQGATIGKPFPGVHGISPGDSGVIDLEAHGGEIGGFVSVGCGLAPKMSAFDSEVMAKLSVDEAVRNIIVSGVDPEKICLLDNFCWPDPVESSKNPGGAKKLGQLVDTCKGLYDICKLYRAPLVSGKDSMKNDFRGKNRSGDDLVISIQPTLLVTAMGYGNQKNLCRSVVTTSQQTIYLLGKEQMSFMGSELAETVETIKSNEEILPESWDFSVCQKTYHSFYQLNQKGLIKAAHDVSDGGVLCATAEMLFDHSFGALLEPDFFHSDLALKGFGEGPGMILVAIENTDLTEFEKECAETNVPFKKVAIVSENPLVSLPGEFEISTDVLLKAWKREWSLS